MEAVKAALAEAEKIFAEESANQETVNAAAGKLMDAVTRLLVQKEDSRLDILIQKAEELLEKKDQYTAPSVEKLEAALQEAKDTAANSQATEEEQKQAYNNLAQAMAGLVRKAEKSELKNALDKAKEILENADSYVEDTIANLQEAVNAAQTVYDKEDASTSEVGEAVKNLVNEILKARLLGDVDFNGVVDSADSARILKAAAEYEALTEEEKKAADVNRDGASDSSDASEILKYAAEKIGKF